MKRTIDQVDIDIQIKPKEEEIDRLRMEEATVLSDINEEVNAFRRMVQKIKSGEELDDEDDY